MTNKEGDLLDDMYNVHLKTEHSPENVDYFVEECLLCHQYMQMLNRHPYRGRFQRVKQEDEE